MKSNAELVYFLIPDGVIPPTVAPVNMVPRGVLAITTTTPSQLLAIVVGGRAMLLQIV